MSEKIGLGLLDNLDINKFYKYLLYLAGVILVLSFFFNVQNIETSLVRKFSFYTIVLGVFLWFVDDIFRALAGAIGEGTRHWSDDDQIALVVVMLIFYFAIVGFSLFMWWESVNGLKIF